MKSLLALLVVVGLALTGCGGGSSTSPAVNNTPNNNVATVLSGTAAAGAPIIGQVTVKDSSTPVQSKSALIEANGNYSVDVTGMTAPFVLRAEGTVGSRTYKLHSYAEAADLGGTVNITPFTDLIVANAAGQLAQTLFDNGDFSTLSATEIEAQETALQNKLQNVLTSLGVDSAIDLLHTAFSADHTALDAALDMVRVSVDPVLIEATITNLIDNTSIVDNLESTTDNTTVLDVTSNLATVLTGQQAIYALFDSFSALFAGGLPSSSQLDPFLAADFLQNDQGKAQFITELSTSPSLVGLKFQSLVIDTLDEAAGTAAVTFNPVFSGIVIPTPETWLLAKNGVNWELRGTQEFVDRWVDFICDYNTLSDGSSFKTCGINLGADDMDFSNNGTGNQPIASARVTLLRNNVEVPGVEIFMGVPQFGAAGQLRIFDTDYSDDFMAFGTGTLELDPSLIQVGDLVQFELYTADLDTAGPAVAGTPVVTYTTPIVALPISNANAASYPSATIATQSAFNALTTAGGDLTVSWDPLASGQTIDEIALMLCDTIGNCTDVWEEFPQNGTTLTIDTSALDPLATEYFTELRIYTRDLQGRFFLRTYHSVTGSGGTTTTTPTGFTNQMLAGGPSYYVSYPGDPDGTTSAGTTQETIVVSGTGPYSAAITQDYFDAGDALVSSTQITASLTLNQDGTLTATVSGQPDTNFSLNSATADSLVVTGNDGGGSWTDTWYLAQPAGWLQGSVPAAVFTAAMLAGSPTYYISYPGDPDGTTSAGKTQETIAVTGSGPYTATVTQDYFEAGNALVSSTQITAGLTLNQDGTLTATVSGQPDTIFTLDSATATYLLVTGTDGGAPWTDYWFLSQPAGWLF